MQETWFRALGQEDLLEKEMTTHPCVLAWTEESGGLQSIGQQRLRHGQAVERCTEHRTVT